MLLKADGVRIGCKRVTRLIHADMATHRADDQA
jgi:hypothetical protein